MTAPKPEAIAARARRAKVFARHDAAAEAGIHIPSFGELLRNQAFCGGRWEDDAQAFAERLLLRIEKEPLLSAEGRQAIERLALVPTIEQCLEGAHILRGLSISRPKAKDMLEQAARRCELYAATRTHRASMFAISGYAAEMSEADETPGDECLQYARAALGWLVVAATYIEPWPQVWFSPRRQAATHGSVLIERIFLEHMTYVVPAKEKPDTFGQDLLAKRGKLPASFDLGRGPVSGTVVVVPSIGNPDIGEGKKLNREFGDLIGQPLPLVPTPDLSVVARTLNDAFPHAVHITSVILSELVGRDHVRLPPILFVGPPGSGKSHYAVRLLEQLNIKAAAYPCGGVADAAFAGTSRRWSTGTPTFPLSLVRQYKTASPGVVLDELERASTSTHNGSIFDALLGMMESGTAATWVDPYLEAPIDLSHVVWIATANTLGQIPGPLKDRFRVFAFQPPTAVHIPTLAHHILQKLVLDLGWDIRWATPLDQEELDALRDFWPGGSMRVLRRYVQGIWRARLRSLTPQ